MKAISSSTVRPPHLRNADQLLRLRRSGARSTVTYKGPAKRERYKSREEIEFDVSDASAFELVLDRLGYTPGFRYEKYRTKFAAPEPGIITIDETPIGVFLELEGPVGMDRLNRRPPGLRTLRVLYRSAMPRSTGNISVRMRVLREIWYLIRTMLPRR